MSSLSRPVQEDRNRSLCEPDAAALRAAPRTCKMGQ